jgi:hypothetical protein
LIFRRNVSPPPGGLNKWNEIPVPEQKASLRQYAALKHWFTFNREHIIIPQQIILFITTTVRISYISDQKLEILYHQFLLAITRKP